MPSGIRTRTSGIMIPAYAATTDYQGPGDLITSDVVAWWGLRGYSRTYALAGGPAIDIVRTSDGANQQTINIRSDGSLDITTISALGYGVSVKKWYDQTGNGHHLVQNTLGNMPTLALNALGAPPASLPALNFSGAASQSMTDSIVTTQAQPVTVSFVYEATDGSKGWIWDDQVNLGVLVNDPASTFDLNLYAGGVANGLDIANSAWHAASALFNGANSLIFIDGGPTGTFNPGAGGMSGNTMIVGQVGGGVEFFTGRLAELGIWGGDKSWFNSPLNLQQQSYWGTPYFATFFQSDASPVLIVCRSMDGIHFRDLGASYNPAPDAACRDPSHIRDQNGTFFIVHTNVANSTNATSTFTLARSDNGGLNWTRVGTVDCSALTGGVGSGRIWAPEFFRDSDNTIYTLFSYSQTELSSGLFQFGITQATNLQTNSWTVPTQVTGTGISSDVIDPFVVKRSSVYWLWYKNETTDVIKYISSTTLGSGYDGTPTDLGYAAQVEAPCLISLGGARWVLYNDGPFAGPEVKYSLSQDTWASWSPQQTVVTETAVGSVRHGTVTIQR